MTTLKEFKRDLIEDIIEYPQLYKDEYWVYDILTMDRSLDDNMVHAEYTPWGVGNDGAPIYKLSNFGLIHKA